MSLPLVDIDGSGRFKYVLLRMLVPGHAPVTVLRGYLKKTYHADVMDEAISRAGAGASAECLGGGRIEHDAAKKTLLVYGYSQAYGRGDHAAAVEMLRGKFPSYEITWTNDGY
jgi:phosphohistidine phosphatase